MDYRNKTVLVTGGLGFIGSNLAVRLSEMGARVTIVDSSRPGCGANPYNIASVADRLRLITRDLGEAQDFAEALRSCDVVFNLAGEVSHIHSMMAPERDLEINTAAQLRFLEILRRERPGVRVVYAGTRQVYGAPRYLPVDEDHPVEPVDYNGVHKHAASQYHLMLSRVGALDAVVLRLTNVYGPRMALRIPCQGVLSAFLRRALLGEDLEVYDSGEQLRDPVHVDDVVEAFLLAGAASSLRARTYNVGGPEALSLRQIAETIAQLTGVRVVTRPFPADRKRIDIGSYRADSSRFQRDFAWSPRIRFAEGIRRSIEWYRQHFEHYLDAHRPALCGMPEHQGRQRRLKLVPA
ncbi:MAG: NAD-dependent epimerase/dehydratase family protein [Bryobacterales bacterium]|nr:NAD-dependent epimerase/dehydratase family protein [Bryobacteraceae bacterium]MDW8129471.1 NAD-dependent epimerase/dehydratase family protein [Bryobacterales bacterium]